MKQHFTLTSCTLYVFLMSVVRSFQIEPPSRNLVPVPVPAVSLTGARALTGDAEWSDFDDFGDIGGDDNDGLRLSEVLNSRSSKDLAACRSRQVGLVIG